MSLSPRLAVLLAAAALLTAIAPAPVPASTGDGPTATAARKCSAGDFRSYGTTYVYSPITARNVSCRRARRLVRAFHKCRPGPKGRCPSVDGYSCSENRFNKSRFQYDSIATCRRGGKLVKHKYTQNI
jgi:hypothetical protein